MDIILQDKMELALVAAVINLSEKCERKTRKNSKFDTHQTNMASSDHTSVLEKLHHCTLLNGETSEQTFGPVRKKGVCERDEEERFLVIKALKHYNRLKHLGLNF